MREKLLALGCRVNGMLNEQPDVEYVSSYRDNGPFGACYTLEVEYEGERFVIEVKEAKSAR